MAGLVPAIHVFFVIASEAKQSRLSAADPGLLRRHSPSKTGVNALSPCNDDRATPAGPARSGGAIPDDVYPSRAGTRFADDPIAALSDAAGAATAHAGFLEDRGGAVVVPRKPPFSEIHFEYPWFV
jgi:hypothetical protein